MDAQKYETGLVQARDFLRARVSPFPSLAIIAGTGLGSLADELTDATSIPYGEIPHFPVSTVESHAGQLVAGRLGGRRVLLFQGRFHLYEGYSPATAVFPLRAAFRCGVKGLVVTNAAGGLDLAYSPGDLMLIRDHINLMGENPLAGPHLAEWGERFPDMSRAYDSELRTVVRDQARKLGIRLHEGVYLAVRGPSLETPAETRFFRLAGADAIGMSTVQEVIAAVQAGVRVLGFSMITNVNNPDDMAPTSAGEIIAAAHSGASALGRLIRATVARWPEGE